MTTSEQQAAITPTTGMRKCARNMTMCHAAINHLSPESSRHCREWTIQDNRAFGVVCNSMLLFPKLSSRKQKVSARQSKTQLPIAITKHRVELGQLNKYLERLLPGTPVSSRDAAVSSRTVAFLNKLDRLLWGC